MTSNREPGAIGTPEHPSPPRFFTRRGKRYIHTYFRRIPLFLVLGMCLVVWGLVRGSGIGVGVGIACMAVTVLFVYQVVLNAEAKTLEVFIGYGLWKRTTFPFSEYRGMTVIRSTTNLYSSATVEMNFANDKSYPLIEVYTPGMLEGIMEEAEAIIRAIG